MHNYLVIIKLESMCDVKLKETEAWMMMERDRFFRVTKLERFLVMEIIRSIPKLEWSWLESKSVSTIVFVTIVINRYGSMPRTHGR